MDRRDVTLELLPAARDTGLVVEYRGIRTPISPAILAVDPEFQHTTSLRTQQGMVRTVEHLLAAVTAFGLTNVVIRIDDCGHVPFFDGSAVAFCEAILDAGTTSQGAFAWTAEVTEEIEIRTGAAWVQFAPASLSTLTLDANIEFAAPIGRQRITYRHGATEFVLRLASARTFLSVPWSGRPPAALPGFYHRTEPYPDTNMVTHDGRRFHVSLRTPDECVRHRALDILGDVAVLGVPLHAKIAVNRGGHALMRRALAVLATELEIAWALSARTRAA